MSTGRYPPLQRSVARRPSQRRGRQGAPLPRWVLAAFGMALVAFVVGLVIGARHESPQQRLARSFAAAWSRHDYAGMYADASDAAHRRWSGTGFAAAYREAAATATARALRIGRPFRRAGAWRVPVTATTRIFGTVRGSVALPMTSGSGPVRIAWTPSLTFPGLRAGERLTRRLALPPRADLLARDGTPLAQGPDRSSPLGALASQVTGTVGPIPPARLPALRAAGVPADAQVGVNGLERILDDRLRGEPGGDLLAGPRVIAHAAPRAGGAVHTTISPSVEQAAVTALGGRLGGVIAFEPRNGEVLAFAGIAFSTLQPPGSTFKMVTVTGVLANGVAKPSDSFPVQTQAVIEGVPLQNANGESCGGTLVQAFANSCNSVFAPLGAKLGARRLVATAERFGFNQDPGVPGAATSTIPPPDQIGDDLAVGSSAIGQGRVQATPLQMARVAATIGLRGRRP
ncbi:MAG TPA: penicillin-binding transpeptidase domain-containing protein, partial [Solirubrobacteraceae bacterium]|nr:penicillin-binding transpeptidase domain-containing protein [Solirubrobacteraceae bacterium]